MNNFSIAYIFTDHMVLQRRKPIAVFGKGNDGINVTVSLDGETAKTVVTEGKWKVFLPPMEAKENLTLSVEADGFSKKFTDVCIGEVWLAGGQSNMELELQNALGGKDHLKNDHPNVRFFYTPKDSYECKERTERFENSSWMHFDEESAKSWSAVGYLFGKELSEKLGVTVGILGCNYGGTSASVWMSREDLENGQPDVKIYLTEFEDFIKGRSLEEQKKEYDDYLAYRAEWEPKCNKIYEEDPNADFSEIEKTIGPSKYPGPVNSYNPMRPMGLYYLMIREVIEYTLAGIIYYQGESDDHRPKGYYNLFEALIKRWRKDNGDADLPFIAVQLPMHRYKQDPDFKNWPVIRRAQRMAIKNAGTAGLAVAIDCGTWNDIHPKDKHEVAHRLCLQALNIVYKKITDNEANGPRIISFDFRKGYADVSFAYADDGFTVKGDEIKGFELAPCRWEYKDEDFVPAKAEILPNGKIRLTAPGIENPGNARYLFTNWGEVTLYGNNGIPVEPF